MLRHQTPLLSYVRGGFSIGSRHQKHMSFGAPPYLYRFPFKQGGTSIMSKYMHTLGTLPTGLEIPFRLEEFHANYIHQHVPQELEDWLRCVVYDPAETILSNMEVFMQRMSDAPELKERRRTVFQRPHLLDCKNVHAPLQKVFDEFGVEIPVIAVRAAASNKRIREDLLDCCFAYHETVSQIGSTPHRRWAATASLPSRQQVYEQLDYYQDQGNNNNNNNSNLLPSLSSSSSSSKFIEPEPRHLSPKQQEVIGKTLRAVLSFPVEEISNSNSNNNSSIVQQSNNTDESSQPSTSSYRPTTAPDELLATKMLTTLAEGCHKAKQGQSNEAATKLLEAALNFAGDDARVSGATHANLSSCYSASGNFEKAQLHAREAVLKDRSNPRAFAAWTVATAMQEDLDEALQISADALQEHPNSQVLQQVHEQVCRAASGRTTTPEAGRNRRYVLQSQLEEGLRMGQGAMFDHEFNLAKTVSGKNVATGLDPRYAGLGTDMRRVGWMSGHIHETVRD